MSGPREPGPEPSPAEPAASEDRPAWFGAVADSLGSASWIYDPARRRIEYSDPGLEGIWGVSIASIHEMIDKLGNRNHQGALASFLILMDSQRVGAPPGCFDYRTRRPGGATVWIRVRYIRVFDPQRGREVIVGSSTDVTDFKRAEAESSEASSELEARVRDRTAELLRANQSLSREIERRVQAERELERSQAQLRELLDHSFELYCEVDEEGRYTSANPQLLATLGYEPEELIGQHFSLVVRNPEDLREIERVVYESDRSIEGGLHRATRRDGREVFVEWCSVRSTDEHPRRLRCIGRDVTDRVRAERRFTELFQSGPEAQIAVDREGSILLFNREAERLYGWKASDVIGRNVWMLIPKRDRTARAEMMTRFMAAPTPWRLGEDLGISALRADGTEVPVEMSLAPLVSGDDLLLVASLRDISARRRERTEKELLEAQLRQWQKLESLGALAGGIAHDFNNLLAAVVNYANVALLRCEDESPIREDLSQIKQAAGRMSELATQMLTYAGRGPTRSEPVDLSAEIQQIRALLVSSLPKSAALEQELSGDLPAAQVDPAQLRQIVMNLVINGTEALEDGQGRLLLRTGVLDGRERQRYAGHLMLGELPARAVYVEVGDTGRGMDPETVQRMFEPFYSTKEAGRGLGLASVLGIVRRHGGAIGVRSRPGNGTRVLVALPASEQGSGASPSTPGPRRRIEGALILLVDDEDAVRESGRRLLEARGARTVACADGESALRVLRESRTGFDAVVLDLTMPGMDGMAVLREIRALDPRLPVVLCSGYRPPSDAFPPDPYRVFASKPYDLVEVTAQALGLPRLASPDASAPDRVRASASRAAPPGSSPRA